MNKHRHTDMQDSWESYEYLFREKLESLDNLTRSMIKDMQAAGTNMTQIRRFVPGKFQQLWDEVAERQEEKHGRKWRS